MTSLSSCNRHLMCTVTFVGLICPFCEALKELEHVQRQHEQFRDEVEFAEDRTKE